MGVANEDLQFILIVHHEKFYGVVRLCMLVKDSYYRGIKWILLCEVTWKSSQSQYLSLSCWIWRDCLFCLSWCKCLIELCSRINLCGINWMVMLSLFCSFSFFDVHFGWVLLNCPCSLELIPNRVSSSMIAKHYSLWSWCCIMLWFIQWTVMCKCVMWFDHGIALLNILANYICTTTPN